MAKSGGQPPYGFRWEGQQLVAHDPEAAIRRRAFELFAELGRKGAVAAALNRDGYRTRRGAEWRDVNVKRLLECGSARGRYPVNKTTTDASGRRVNLPETDWEYLACPPIVSEALWDEVQAILAAQREPGAAPVRPTVHPFAGLVVCGCGSGMRLDGKAAKFVCPACRNKVTKADLNRMFEDELRVTVLPTLQGLAGDPASQAASEIGAEIDGVRARMDSLEALFHEGKISLERFGEGHAPLLGRREDLEAQLDALSPKGSSELAGGSPASAPDIGAFAGRWPDLADRDRKRLLSLLVKAVVVRRDVVEFNYWISDPSSKEDPSTQHTASPTDDTSRPPAARRGDPEYIRLPKPGTRCERTGLSRSKLNTLILPSERNSFRPPVASKTIRQKGKTTGVRLIVWESLKAYLESQNA